MGHLNDKNANQTSNLRQHRPSEGCSSSSSSSSSGSGSSSSGFSSTSTTNPIGTSTERSVQQRSQDFVSSFDANVLHNQAKLMNNNEPSPFKCFLNALSRKKPLDCRTDTNLNRCLNLLDLTALGVGSTLGLGLYVLAGQVASNKAGPGVILSFALAALASAFSALCYAEFAGKVPRAGSAYAYSYITVGEFVAFIIGWNLILEYVIGAASVARGFSGYLCFVFEHLYKVLSKTTSEQTTILNSTATATTTRSSLDEIDLKQSTAHPIVLLHNNHFSPMMNNMVNNSNFFANTSSSIATATAATAAAAVTTTTATNLTLIDQIINYVSEYFDWPSIVIIIIITMFVLFGVKESTNVTMAFTSLNLLVVLIVCLSSFNYLNIKNWQLKSNEIPQGFGNGGFLPYGWSGVLAGSATCFFGFIGFDTIASSAEEAKNPKKNVPLSIILSLFISFLAYMSIAIVQTLIWPYYDQNNVTILPYIYSKLNLPFVYWIVLFGAIAGLASSQLGGMYPLPRILYSMANDKLIYSYLANINKRLKLPVRATIVGSTFIAILSCLLNIQDLADMVSIGTLAAYSLVSLSVLILRYEDRSRTIIDDSTILNNNHLTLEDPADIFNNNNNNDNNRNVSNESSDENSYNKPKLTAKPSTPIRERGSRPVVAQLSVGFNSWFKNHIDTIEEQEKVESFNEEEKQQQQQREGRRRRKKNSKSLIDLLISWKSFDDGDFHQVPTNETSKQSKILISILVILCILLDLTLLCITSQPTWLFNDNDNDDDDDKKPFLDPMLSLKATSCIILVLLTAIMLMLSRLPTGNNIKQGNNTNNNNNNNMFQVPWVPLIPTLSILVNTFLMLNLSYLTWVRFTVWMAFGLFIYFTYGIWNSEGYLLYLDR